MGGEMEWIRKTYGVPAKRGGTIEYTDARGMKWKATIRGAKDGYLVVLEDGLRSTIRLHPTWNIRYTTPPEGDGR